MNKKLIISLMILIFGLFMTITVKAENSTRSGKLPFLKPTIKEEKIELKKELLKLRTSIKEVKAKLNEAEITAVNGVVLSVSKEGITYTVNTDSNTKFRRKFWGKSSLAEISVGDKVNIWGKFTDDAKTIIQALMIRDTSIQKKNGVFFGTIKSKTTENFIMTTINRGDQTVYMGGAYFIDRTGKPINYSQIEVGDRVRIRGLWDKTLSKITEVNEVKDFSIPFKPSITPKVSVTTTP